MNFRSFQLGDLFRVKHGYAFKSAHFAAEGRYIVMTPGHFKEEGGFKDQGPKTKFYSGDVPEDYVLHEKDVVVVMTEQMHGLLGSSVRVSQPDRFLHNQRLGKIVDVDTNRADEQFLYYLFNTRRVRAQIAATASGTKVRHTSPGRIGDVEVSIPDVTTQKRIAEVLSAYDDLIANNTRRIKLLEDAARLLYEEWFVRLRFPGHETAKIKDGVPEGWERKRPRRGLRNHRWWDAFNFKTPSYWEGRHFKWCYTFGHHEESQLHCASGYWPADHRWRGAQRYSSAKIFVPPGTILMTSRASDRILRVNG